MAWCAGRKERKGDSSFPLPNWTVVDVGVTSTSCPHEQSPATATTTQTIPPPLPLPLMASTPLLHQDNGSLPDPPFLPFFGRKSFEAVFSSTLQTDRPTDSTSRLLVRHLLSPGLAFVFDRGLGTTTSVSSTSSPGEV